LNRPLVVAVHGAVTNAASWLPVQRMLPEHIEFAAVDLPGHGTRGDSKFSVSASLQIIEAALPNTANERPVVLIGDSLGGYLALMTAARVGDRVHCVVASGASADMRGRMGQFAELTEIGPQLMQFILGEKRTQGFFSTAMRLFTDQATSEAVEARGINMKSRAATIEALRSVDIIAAIKACKGRVYIVNGSLDLPLARNTRLYAGYAARGYAVEIPHAFHGCALTRPAEFADVVMTAVAAAQVDLAHTVARPTEGDKKG
jgi:pimeloyl-ACP methyl ester carboxylesterase